MREGGAMGERAGVIRLRERAGELSGAYENVVVCAVNDHVVRLSRMTAPYPWHLHPNSDETFIGVEGTVVLELEGGRRVELGAEEMFTVPRGVRHRTAPAGAHSVNLTIERADLETVRLEEYPAVLRRADEERVEEVRPGPAEEVEDVDVDGLAGGEAERQA